MKILCVLGKYQYGELQRGISPEYGAFIPSLKRLGHEVVHFELWNKSFYSNYAELNKSLLETVESVSPDVMLAVQLNYEIWLETLQIIKNNYNVATICWTTDDSWKYDEVSRFIGPHYHAMTTTYPDVLPKYHKDGINNVLLTQWAANLESLKNPLPAKECRYTVSFVGTAHGNRKKRIIELNKHGIDVSCFGYGWPAGPVDISEIPKIMRESVISLNFAKSRGENQIKARTFEVPGAGGFLLTEYASGLENYYDIGSEIDVFRDNNEIVEKINFYLANPEKRNTIANAGFERTANDHTYDVRMKDLLEFAFNARNKWVKQSVNDSSYMTFNNAVDLHKLIFPLKFLREILILIFSSVWGKRRGPRAARRFVFEICWRICGKKTFTASGWPGIMFPDQ